MISSQYQVAYKGRINARAAMRMQCGGEPQERKRRNARDHISRDGGVNLTGRWIH